MYVDENKNEALPGFEPRSLESESNALTNYAITPVLFIPRGMISTSEIDYRRRESNSRPQLC